MKLSGFIVCALTSLMVTGCSGEDSGTEPAETTEMTAPAPVAATTESTPLEAVEENGLSSIYQAAIADPRRPEEDVARDPGRKPVEVMEFFGIVPGQRVVDISSGGGYFTRIISAVVGDTGSVIANNSGSRVTEEYKANLQQQYADYTNVELNYETPEQISLPDDSVDAVLLALIVHHWHYSEESGESIPAFAPERYNNIYRMLKPGGVFAVIEHEAAAGMSRAASNEIHRIPAEIAIADITSAGFVLDGESDIHADYPDDDMTARWSREPRDVTRRIVHRYRKPADQ